MCYIETEIWLPPFLVYKFKTNDNVLSIVSFLWTDEHTPDPQCCRRCSSSCPMLWLPPSPQLSWTPWSPARGLCSSRSRWADKHKRKLLKKKSTVTLFSDIIVINQNSTKCFSSLLPMTDFPGPNHLFLLHYSEAMWYPFWKRLKELNAVPWPVPTCDYVSLLWGMRHLNKCPTTSTRGPRQKMWFKSPGLKKKEKKKPPDLFFFFLYMMTS